MHEGRNDIIVYKHIREDNNEVCYIGITGNKKRAFRRSHRNPIYDNIKSKTPIRVELIYTDLTWEEACQVERYLISYYGRIKSKTGTLANITDGGEGFNYWKGKTRDNEFKKKASSRMKGNTLAKGNNNQAKKVIDNSNGVIYNSIKEASEKLGIKRQTLNAYLNGQNPNKTNLTYF